MAKLVAQLAGALLPKPRSGSPPSESRAAATSNEAPKSGKARKAASPAAPEPAAASPSKLAEPAKIKKAKKPLAAKPEPAPEPVVVRTPGKVRAHPDAGLTAAQVKQLHRKLVEERDRINARIRSRVGQATLDSSPLSEEGDQAQRATEQDYQLRLADKQQKLLEQVLAALSKFETGEYGICEGSEEPIGFRRLEIRPWARYSVEYKEMLDRQNR
jgi:DnaK suppressor protein